MECFIADVEDLGKERGGDTIGYCIKERVAVDKKQDVSAESLDLKLRF